MSNMSKMMNKSLTLSKYIKAIRETQTQFTKEAKAIVKRSDSDMKVGLENMKNILGQSKK